MRKRLHRGVVFVLAMGLGTIGLGTATASADWPTSAECQGYGYSNHLHATITYGAPGNFQGGTALERIAWVLTAVSVGHAQFLLRNRFGQQIGIDCIWGLQTDIAVKNVQGFCKAATGRHDIALDGIIGPVTWKILDTGNCYA